MGEKRDSRLGEVRRLLREAKEILGATPPRISLSARQLELYSKMPGSAVAAKEISEALTKAARELHPKLEKVKSFSERTIGPLLKTVWKTHVEPVMSKHNKFGANDMEPHHRAGQALIDMVKNHYGVHSYTSLGDYF
jgi:hypothetical protein